MKRFVKTTLAAALFAMTFQAHAADAKTTTTTTTNNAPTVTPADKAKIEQVVHQYLLQNPEVIIEAVQNYQRKQMEQAEQTVKKTQQAASSFAAPLFHQPNDPVGGNPNGQITVVEFFDYQCPHCIDMVPTMEAIIKANPDVRVIYKEFPIRGPVSDFAARAALAANKQGKYIEFSHALLAAKRPLTQEIVLDVAKNSGLDVDKLKKDMNDKNIDEQIKATVKLAKDLQLFGTPAFFIGKTDTKTTGSINYVPGQMDQNQLQGAIDTAKKA